MGNEMVKAAPQQQLSVGDQMQYAKMLAGSSIIPDSYRNNPANILVAEGFGQSMGLSAAESLYRITVIKGKPTASAELIASNVRRAGHRLRVRKDRAKQTATVQIVRADDPDFTFESTWDMDRARQAQLAGKDNWKKYPLAMLTARAITECARDACPEALYGVVYTGEEMGASRTDEQGFAEPVPVQATVEPQAAPGPQADPLQPIRELMGEYVSAVYPNGERKAAMREAMNDLLAYTGADSMRDLTAEQASDALAWMRERIQGAGAPEDPEPVPAQAVAEAVEHAAGEVAARAASYEPELLDEDVMF